MITWFGASASEATQKLIRATVEAHVGELEQCSVEILPADRLLGHESVVFRVDGMCSDGGDVRAEVKICWNDL
jgi:hypothetical protein